MSDLILFFDTETTGLPEWSTPSDDPCQPHLVQLAALLVDPIMRDPVQSMDVIVCPSGWEIPQDVVDIHGINAEYARDVGVREDAALNLFLELWRAAEFRVAHNESFDARLIRIAIKRYIGDATADEWKAGKAVCTGRLAKSHMGITGRRIPKLSEAYEHFTGQTIKHVHSALGDTLACADVYWSIPATDQAATQPQTDEIEV